MSQEVGPFNLFTDPTGVYPEKENEMSKELVAKLRDPNHWSSDDSLAAADLIESQAKELAEAQLRVVELRDALKEAVDEVAETFPFLFLDRANEALASTDTAAQTLRQQADQQAQPVAEIKLVDVMGKGLQNHLIFKDGALNSLPVGTKFFTSPPAQPQAGKDQRVIEAAEKMRYDFSEQNRAEYDKAKQS